MNEQLIKFIELCLVDGVISEKEREVIFRKSKELGVPDDECEIILDGMISQCNKINNKEVKDNINKDIDIKESYINLDTPQDWITNLNTINEKIADYLNSENEKIKTFISSGKFKKSIKRSPFVMEKNILDNMINQPKLSGGFFSTYGKKHTLEFEEKNQIKNILDNEEFFGYSIYKKNALDEEGLNREIKLQKPNLLGDFDYWDNYSFTIFTNKGIHTFVRSSKNSSRKSKSGFISYESLKEQHEIVDWIELKDPPLCYSRFLFLYSEDFKIKDLILNLKLTFDDGEFIEKVSSLKLKDEDLNNLMRIHHFIISSINEHNIRIDKLNITEIYIIDHILNSNKTQSLSYRLLNCKKTDCSNLESIKKLINYQKNFISVTMNLLKIRDIFLNYLIKLDTVNSKKTILKLEDLGVLNTKFERDLLNSLDKIGKQLSLLNTNIISITETLTSHLQSIENKLEIQNDKLSEVSGQLSYNNLLSTINTFQVLQINKKLN